MKLVAALILVLAWIGMVPSVALASHLGALREAGEGFRVSTLGLILFGLVSFLVLGLFIVLGLRWLNRMEKE